ncbi:MAG: hypothetical protein CM1200mP16_03620 [Nitrospina sp.]|nr:MAG: hypothetical protein CM1200mP16_03620 [Nitrospina sp.]
MYWAINGQSGDSACFQLIYIDVGRDVPDMRDELWVQHVVFQMANTV